MAMGHQDSKPSPRQTYTLQHKVKPCKFGHKGGQLQAHTGGESGSWLCAGRMPNGVGQAAMMKASVGSWPDLGP